MSEALPSPGRLRWLCRRGTRELDQIMGGFLEEDFAAATPGLQRAFIALLHCQDPDIYDWLMGASAPDEPELVEIVNRLQTKFGL